MAHCPKCKSKHLRRSRTRSRWERWRKIITDKRPYRCRACQWRGWLPMSLADMDVAISQPQTPSDPPNLRGTLLARHSSRRTIDLKELDRFDDPAGKDDA